MENSDKSRKDLKLSAKNILKGRWGLAAVATLIYLIICVIPGSFPPIGTVIVLIIGGPLVLGYTIYMFAFSKGENVKLEILFDGFKHFVPSLILYLLILVFTVLWSLLLIIPGIIAALRYSMAFFILYENPDMAALDALNKSKEMMAGHKMELFMLLLSFILWFLLIIVTLGIASFWVTPYIFLTVINFYENLKTAKPAVESK